MGTDVGVGGQVRGQGLRSLLISVPVCIPSIKPLVSKSTSAELVPICSKDILSLLTLSLTIKYSTSINLDFLVIFVVEVTR